jgi:hypothetical protein
VELAAEKGWKNLFGGEVANAAGMQYAVCVVCIAGVTFVIDSLPWRHYMPCPALSPAAWVTVQACVDAALYKKSQIYFRLVFILCAACLPGLGFVTSVSPRLLSVLMRWVGTGLDC